MKRIVLALSMLLAACGGYDGAGGGTGATVGGIKDLRLARELIAHGQVPPPAALLVEGMFAEHDLGLAGDACLDTLCLRAAAGIAPDTADVPHGWIQVGLSSDVNPDTYQRPATTFIFTVDTSGSMGWGADREYSTPGELARQVMHRLADRIGPADRAAIVEYGSSVTVPLAFTSDPAALHAAIDRLGESGVTDMESGVRKALELGRQARARGEAVRIVVFTDAQPNVGATAPSEFEQLVAGGAADGIGTTVLGLGLGMGPEIMQSMAHVRGANAFGVLDDDDVNTFMTDEYPWFVTPIAFDLSVGLRLPAGLDVDTPYGFPTGFAEDPTMRAASVFLSNRRGALLVSIAGDAEALAGFGADLDLSWTTPGGFARQASLHVARGGAIADDRGQWFQQPAIERTTALALFTAGMHDAAEQYAFSPSEAEVTMTAAQARFEADAAASGAPDLAAEVDLGRALLQLIHDRAPQGTLYGP
ncbi:MAG TPA: VWA domain-containing protein [Kofleriaceae bacterium]|nr:VWA domain-containing protein [Kofleriaceae bacterium]